MKKKQLSWNLVLYELRNLAGNIMVVIFGVAFPILLSVLFSTVFKDSVPEELYSKVVTSNFITMSMIIPLAIMLIGYAANYSVELEEDIPLRLNLFGFSQKTMLAAKLIAYLIFMTASFLLYTCVDYLLLDVQVPKPGSALCLIAALYSLSVILFVLAHGLATLIRRFGPTFAVSMILYFGFMILCGMMGITVDQLPSVLKAIARMLPMSYISSDFVEFWQGGSYHFAPMIQSYLFLGAVSFLILILSFYKVRRKTK